MPFAMGWASLLALVGSDFGEISSVVQEELNHWAWDCDSENESSEEVPDEKQEVVAWLLALLGLAELLVLLCAELAVSEP